MDEDDSARGGAGGADDAAESGEVAHKSVRVDAGDVVRLILQHLKEAKLVKAMDALQEETGVVLNSVESLSAFNADITSGRWDAVLKQCATLKLPMHKLGNLYEQVIVEMAELGETDTARALLRNSAPIASMREAQPERAARLERCVASAHFNENEVYVDGRGREERRADLARELCGEVTVVPPRRLVSLLGQALKWQQHTGDLPPGGAFDLFRGAAPKSREEVERFPRRRGGVVKFAKKSHSECAVFTADGAHLVTGSVDGFVEVWDCNTGKIDKNLAYQAKDEFMMHDEAVISITSSDDGEMIATGATDGRIKVWKVETGALLRKISGAHAGGVTCMCFSKDGMRVLSGSHDRTARVHGLRAGKLLKEFRGHDSFVNAVVFVADGSRVLTGSSDGSVKLWDSKTTNCVSTFNPPSASMTAQPSVVALSMMPRNASHVLVATRSPSVHVMTLSGEVLQTFTTGKKEGADIVACTISPRGHYIYALATDRKLYCFSVDKGTTDHAMVVHDREPTGLAVHPMRNLVATFTQDPVLRLWKA